MILLVITTIVIDFPCVVCGIYTEVWGIATRIKCMMHVNRSSAQELVRLRWSAEIRVVNTGPRAAGAPCRRESADRPAGVGRHLPFWIIYIRTFIQTDIHIDCTFASAPGNNANLVSRNGHQQAVGRTVEHTVARVALMPRFYPPPFLLLPLSSSPSSFFYFFFSSSLSCLSPLCVLHFLHLPSRSTTIGNTITPRTLLVLRASFTSFFASFSFFCCSTVCLSFFLRRGYGSRRHNDEQTSNLKLPNWIMSPLRSSAPRTNFYRRGFSIYRVADSFWVREKDRLCYVLGLFCPFPFSDFQGRLLCHIESQTTERMRVEGVP